MRRPVLIGGGLLVLLAAALLFHHLLVSLEARIEEGYASVTEADPDRPREALGAEAPRERGSRRVVIADSAAAEGVPDGEILVTGRVFDLPAGGNPAGRIAAGGVTVRARRGVFGGLGDAGSESETVTDEEGGFRLVLEDEDRRPLRLLVFALGTENHRGGSLSHELEEGETAALDLEIDRLLLGVVCGETVDTLGASVSGVELWLPEEEPELRTFSDEQGRFCFDAASRTDELAAKKPGYAVVEARSLYRRNDGGWKDARVVLAPVGALRVLVTDVTGAPVADREIAVGITAAEPFGYARGRGPGLGWHNRIPGARTDANGVTSFPAVWAGLQLRVDFGWRQPAFERLKWEDGIARAVSEDGQPIVVDKGETREIHVVLPTPFRVSGRVVRPDGSPMAGAELSL